MAFIRRVVEILISSILETNSQGVPDDTTSLGVSVGEGMIHYALVSSDVAGRMIVESRVFDVDLGDGLDSVGRVNAGIDLMLDAARVAGAHVGPIGVAARTATQRRELRSGGSGTRRQVQLVADEEAVAAMLAKTGQIERFDSVLVADVGDTGMSLYLVAPKTGRISRFERSTVLSGQQIDHALADHVASRSLSEGSQTRRGRDALLSACRTAKEEAGAGGAATFSLSSETIEEATRPHIDHARAALARYLAGVSASGGPSPEAVVLVGGLANLAVVATGLAAESGLEVIVPPTPELVAATGAAMVTRTSTAAGRLAFIGGRRARRWFAAPAAIGIACVSALLVAAVAVGATIAGGSDPGVSPVVTSQRPAEVSEVRDSGFTTTSQQRSVTSHTNRPVVPAVPEQQDSPGWATTELSRPTTWTSTLTLAPNTPSTSVPPSSPPSTSTTWTRPSLTFPSGLIPSGLLPTPLAPMPAPQPAPSEVPRGALQPQPTPEATTTTPAR